MIGYVALWILCAASVFASVAGFLRGLDNEDTYGFRFGFAMGFLCLAAGIYNGTAVANTSPGTGEKTGTVVKLSQVGLICPTWEAQLIRGGFANGTGVAGTVPFDFTIEDTTVLRQVRESMEAGREIRLQYRTLTITRCRSESSNHFATNVQPMSVQP